MDRKEKLRIDWKTDPQLQHLAFTGVDELEAHLLTVHRFLVGPDGGAAGYLYKKQIERARSQNKVS